MAAPPVADFALRLPIPNTLKRGFYPIATAFAMRTGQLPKDHLIIVGFGIVGRNVARAARIGSIPYVIVELNPETVKRERLNGEPIIYGDAVQEDVLERGRIMDARVMVLAIPDPVATRRITSIAHKKRADLRIIARTRFLEEVTPLCALGADEVIPEEFETSLAIFRRVLINYSVPREDIDKLTAEVRSDGYEMFRKVCEAAGMFSDTRVTPGKIDDGFFKWK
jgi:CPA2 family monovalent cation:H+ antiporter-2